MKQEYGQVLAQLRDRELCDGASTAGSARGATGTDRRGAAGGRPANRAFRTAALARAIAGGADAGPCAEDAGRAPGDSDRRRRRGMERASARARRGGARAGNAARASGRRFPRAGAGDARRRVGRAVDRRCAGGVCAATAIEARTSRRASRAFPGDGGARAVAARNDGCRRVAAGARSAGEGDRARAHHRAGRSAGLGVAPGRAAARRSATRATRRERRSEATSGGAAGRCAGAAVARAGTCRGRRRTHGRGIALRRAADARHRGRRSRTARARSRGAGAAGIVARPGLRGRGHRGHALRRRRRRALPAQPAGTIISCACA